ncbi:hypothetical protein L226DRAFT_219370 [Lentinus tigrinus ALCF2SS1-7]|uniref:uncharacterized protein n=1 Tax=Lentinus tigrinus ALCF2SS1-7 TaxID=1328758 RepID=UPI001165D522|nr:hypothetical protein L226DRAFT_219370 [Lentinus tigrinus ALCF2SS1-7]
MHCSCAPSGFVRLIWQVTDHWSSATKGPSAQSNTHASSHQTLPFIGPRDCPLEHQAIMIPLCSDPGTGTHHILARLRRPSARGPVSSWGLRRTKRGHHQDSRFVIDDLQASVHILYRHMLGESIKHKHKRGTIIQSLSRRTYSASPPSLV